MKNLTLSFLLLLGTLSLKAQTYYQVVQDTVKIVNAELSLGNKTKQVNGYLYNTGNGITSFQKLQLANIGDSAIAIVGQDTLKISLAGIGGSSVQFRTGYAVNYPSGGDSSYTNPVFKNKNIKVWRNGLLQYRDSISGITFDSIVGKVQFYPPLLRGDRVYIEALGGVDLVVAIDTAVAITNNLLQLHAGVNGNDNSFTLRWTTNNSTLTAAPIVVGLGSSTLAGYSLSYPDRLGDKISAWLNNNTSSPTWINLAVGGYNSGNILPVSEGGTLGHNIDSALNANPDFIFISLPSNDPSAGISVNQSLANYREIDTMAQHHGIPVFWETTQPRTSYTAAEQTQLKQLADSVRAIWPDRFVEGFNDVVDNAASTDAVIQSQYDNGDGTHLNSAGNQFIANSLFNRWQQYFQAINGVTTYLIETSTDQLNWSSYIAISNQNIVKQTFNRSDSSGHYFRVKAIYTNGGSSAYSNTVYLSPLQAIQQNGGGDTTSLPAAGNNYRILIDLGGDGTNTLNGSGQASGELTASPDSFGKYWNNWTGKGDSGFVSGTAMNNLLTTTNKLSPLSISLVGDPFGTYRSSNATQGINFSGFNVGSSDYPAEALTDNMFMYSSINPDGIHLHISGLSNNLIYTIKFWGARLDNSSTPRYMEAKLASQDWSEAKSFDARYSTSDNPDYNRDIEFTNLSGYDSLDIDIRVGAGSSFTDLSLIDITSADNIDIPNVTVAVNDTSLSLPEDSLQLTGLVNSDGATISSYQWSQLSGPNNTTIVSPAAVSTLIKGLTNGYFTYRLTVNTTDGNSVSDDVTVVVTPDNNNKKTMRLYFSNSPASPIPGWINIYGPVSGYHITRTDSVTSWTFDNGGSTSAYWNVYAGVNASDDGGQSTGDNSGVVPDIALEGYWFNSSKSYTSGTNNIIIGGLDPSKTYTLKLLPSRASSAAPPRYASWHINGGAEILQNASGNTSIQTIVNNVSPDASGNISIAVYSPSNTGTYGSFSYLNTLVIQEN